MTSKVVRYAQAGAISLILFAGVLWVAMQQDINLSDIRPGLLIPAVFAYSLVLVCRAAIFRLLSSSGAQHPFQTWLSLAARHQLVFIISPSGAGDLAFPVLARRMVGLKTLTASRLIVEARLRDIFAVLALGCAGLAGTGHMPVLALAGMLLCFFALYWSEVSVRAVTALLRRFRRTRDIDTPLEKSTKQDVTVSFARRVCLTALTLSLWGSASGGVFSGFYAAGYPLSLMESWVMLAGLNVAGALALSLAGFGVTEAGAAGVLVFLGLPFSTAAAIAIIARPMLLLSNCLAIALVELLARVLGAGGRSI